MPPGAVSAGVWHEATGIAADVNWAVAFASSPVVAAEQSVPWASVLLVMVVVVVVVVESVAAYCAAVV